MKKYLFNDGEHLYRLVSLAICVLWIAYWLFPAMYASPFLYGLGMIISFFLWLILRTLLAAAYSWGGDMPKTKLGTFLAALSWVFTEVLAVIVLLYTVTLIPKGIKLLVISARNWWRKTPWV